MLFPYPIAADLMPKVTFLFCYPFNLSDTTLQLEALVGDLEDAVFSGVDRRTGNMFSAKLSVSTVRTSSFSLLFLNLLEC